MVCYWMGCLKPLVQNGGIVGSSYCLQNISIEHRAIWWKKWKIEAQRLLSSA